ncbi:Oxysterol-binding protein-related protein 3 [Golovinomyces cichoracearum]|uniref:Oxysterol-binding protein-related protein 3 n=1 Tax=Golovinomyces cichoracearum TaxID=62708 RepID=A0A420IDI9_9PEZI|nr:Oxysterol-binding protein-related protein 3 [Golovinomyces cichoracearum]
MVGLEQLEIHSKSYIVRWIKVEEGHSISWSIQPHKKSINFGIFKHPRIIGTELSGAPAVDDAPIILSSIDPGVDKTLRPTNSRNNTSTAQEQLKAKGFIIIKWYGKCEADKVSIGTHAVSPGNGGMYGLIFDNTFSKQYSKTATLVMQTYPTSAPPKNSYYNLNVTSIGLPTTEPSLERESTFCNSASRSVCSLLNNSSAVTFNGNISRGNSVLSRMNETVIATNHAGVLSKRRRKKGQGYANRYFSLDFATCTLSYYYNRNSSALRGAIPLSLAAITADKRRREICIDAGAEIWHLRADNSKDFDEWTKALEQASNIARGLTTTEPSQKSKNEIESTRSFSLYEKEEEQDWKQVEALVSRVVGTRDAIDRLSKETALKELKQNVFLEPGHALSNNAASGEEVDYFNYSTTPEKKTFWRRKCSYNTSSQSLNQQNSLMSSSSSLNASTTNVTAKNNLMPSTDKYQKEVHMHEHCSALLSDLNAVLSDFSELLARNKRRRMAKKNSQQRSSFDSNSTNSTVEFFDAESGQLDHLQVYQLAHSEDDLHLSDPGEANNEFAIDESSISSTGNDEKINHLNGAAVIFPSRPRSLDPLPIKNLVKRRNLIPPAKFMPPSLIGFLRKNVGKDLSTISMPVSANEPLSLLQRTAEQLEYAHLLDKAAGQQLPENRLCYVAAFAISGFSINRCKERSIRKPFNPMLGETFELLRTDEEIPGGFRFLAEKVSHRPVRIAYQADSMNWSISQSPAPTNKFWGKSAEILTEGRIRLVLHLKNGCDELYSWTVANSFLRNVVIGEKYVEPVGSTTIVNESTGAKAIIDYKHKGMFGGRSEDVDVKIHGPDGKSTPISMVGTWTNSLRIVESGRSGNKEIWQVGKLVEGATQRYGLTRFSVSLNEITQIEEGRIPITDCRLRPDQRAVENGDLDEAERLKESLEENQRMRRKKMEEVGEVWRPRWFSHVDGGDEGEEVWKIKSGKESYWEERNQGTWTGIKDIFSL